MNAPAPRANPRLLGHESAEAQVIEAIRTNRLHHAWLITGPRGIGKATLAYRFARALLAGQTEGASLGLPEMHPVFKRVAASSHADLLTVEREYDPKRKRMQTEIVIDSVRDVVSFMHLTPADAACKVVVVDGAETLNRNAANGLLKVLEEPPARSVLILTCETAGSLPVTIRSRCRRLELAPLPQADVEMLLGAYMPDLEPEARARLAGLAEGSIGQALYLASASGIGLAETVAALLADPRHASRAWLAEKLEGLTKTDEGFSDFANVLRAMISNAVRARARGEAVDGVAARPLDALIDAWQRIGELQALTEDLHQDKLQAAVMSISLACGPGQGTQ